MKKAEVILKSGERFEGKMPAWQSDPFLGEVVFTTGMTGYVETLTDPSYADQIIIFTYPLIGNYGVQDKKVWESKKIHAAGAIVSQASPFHYHENCPVGFTEWLQSQNVALICDVDTRSLTKKIAHDGSQPGAIAKKGTKIDTFFDPNDENLVAKVSIKKPTTFGTGKKKVIVVDCGIKENILRHLRELPIQIKQVPYDYDYTKESYDGLFLSNGPGDPAKLQKTIGFLKDAMKKKKPIFGICLGTQLMAHAAGAETYKLKFGHRGHNQPTIDLKSGKCFLTSQNHGYAIDESTLGSDWEVWLRHLNDDTVSGIRHKKLPFFSVQFHPEAAPGPVDTEWLFEEFYQLL